MSTNRSFILNRHSIMLQPKQLENEDKSQKKHAKAFAFPTTRFQQLENFPI